MLLYLQSSSIKTLRTNMLYLMAQGIFNTQGIKSAYKNCYVIHSHSNADILATTPFLKQIC